jgi:Bifunctional DNA primase/polymerase, N-terminal
MSLDSQSAHATPLDDAASAYIRAGFKIFPVFGLRFENGKLVCACGNPTCASPCKHPATAHGLKDATADFDTFVALCNGRRGLNVGVATDGYVAVDVDPGKGGAVAWAKVSTELQLDAAIDGTPQEPWPRTAPAARAIARTAMAKRKFVKARATTSSIGWLVVCVPRSLTRAAFASR